MSEPVIQLKRVYEPPEEGDGYRVLVDRLWPRGVRREAAPFDLWCPDVAPSSSLRRWFHGDPEGRWEAFCHRYREELAAQPDRAAPLLATLAQRPLTLLTAARDPQHSHVAVLKAWLLEQLTAS